MCLRLGFSGPSLLQYCIPSQQGYDGVDCVLGFEDLCQRYAQLVVVCQTGLYLFVGEAVATLFVIFPCYQPEAGAQRMVYDPQSSCGSHGGLVVLSSVAMLAFVVLATYVLGYSFWNQQSIIKNPGTFDAAKVREVHAAFGFLFAEYKAQFFFWSGPYSLESSWSFSLLFGFRQLPRCRPAVSAWRC